MSKNFFDAVKKSQKLVGGLAFVSTFIYEFHKAATSAAKYPSVNLNPSTSGFINGLFYGTYNGVYHYLYPITYSGYILNQLYYRNTSTYEKTPYKKTPSNPQF